MYRSAEHGTNILIPAGATQIQSHISYMIYTHSVCYIGYYKLQPRNVIILFELGNGDLRCPSKQHVHSYSCPRNRYNSEDRFSLPPQSNFCQKSKNFLLLFQVAANEKSSEGQFAGKFSSKRDFCWRCPPNLGIKLESK